MKKTFRKNLMRFCLLLLTGAMLTGTACSITEGPDKIATPEPTELPTIEPETPTAPPLSEEEAYDVSFALPVTSRGQGEVKPETYAAVDGLGRTLSFNGDSYTSSLHSGTVL